MIGNRLSSPSLCRMMLMPSLSSPLPSQLLQSPLLTPYFNATHKDNNHNKILGSSRPVFIITKVSLSLSSTINSNPNSSTPTLSQTPAISNRRRRFCIKEIEKHDISLPIKEEEQESLEVDKKVSNFQVQNFVDRIKELLFEEKVDQILNILGKDRGIWTMSDFNDLLMGLVTANEPDLALKVYSSLSCYSLVPDSWTFSIMVRCHCKKNDVFEAKRVLDRMVQNGFSPNVVTCTTLISSFCKMGQLQNAFQVFEIMNKTGCKPNVQTYNCLLKGLCYVGRVEEAFELLEEIKETTIEPDIYTYTAMMDGFCKVGRTDEAMELLNEAMERGLKPNVVTFNTLLDGYTKEGRPVKGFGVLKLMKQRNCVPDYISYSTLLHGLLLWGKIPSALRIFKEMEGNGYEVNERLMNSLVRGLCRKYLKENDLLEDACEVFEKMKKRVSLIDHSTYRLVIQALCMAKKADDALVNLQHTIRAGYVPRAITINSVIQAFCVGGKVEEAFSVLSFTYENHKIPSRMAYDLLIHELNQQGRNLGACSVYGAALIRGVVPLKKPLR